MSGMQERFGFDKDAMDYLAGEISDAMKGSDARLAIVIGGGNMIRGSKLIQDLGTTPVISDQAGMLATAVNGILLQDFLEHKHGLETRVMSAVEVRAFTEPYIRRRALSHLRKGRVVILVGGTGDPRFTTDTAAVLRAIELESDLVIKGTKVDGIYDRDPNKEPDAKFIETIDGHEFVKQRLGIMDRTAITLAGENNVSVRIFNIFTKGNLKKIISGKKLGSLVTP